MKRLLHMRWMNLLLSLTVATTQILPAGYAQEAAAPEENIQGSYTPVLRLEDVNKEEATDTAEAREIQAMEEDSYLASIQESPLSKVETLEMKSTGLKSEGHLHSKAEVEEMAAILARSYLGEDTAEFETASFDHPFSNASDQIIDVNNPTVPSPRQGSLKLTRTLRDGAVETFGFTLGDQGLQLTSVEVKNGEQLIRSAGFSYDAQGLKNSESETENQFDDAGNQIMSRTSYKNINPDGSISNESVTETTSKYEGKNLVYQTTKSVSSYNNGTDMTTSESLTTLERIYAGEIIVYEKSESTSSQNDVETGGSLSIKKVELDAAGNAVYSDTQSDSWYSNNGTKTEYHYGTSEKSAYDEAGRLLEKVTRSENKSASYSSSSETRLVNTYENGQLIREETQSSGVYNGNQNYNNSSTKNIKRDAAGRSVFEESVTTYNGIVNGRQTTAREYLDETSDKLVSEITSHFYGQGETELKPNYVQSLKLVYNKAGVLIKTFHQQDSYYGKDNTVSYRSTVATRYNLDGKPISVLSKNYGMNGETLELQSSSEMRYGYSKKGEDGKTHLTSSVRTEMDAKGFISIKETKRYDALFSVENPSLREPRIYYDMAMPAYSYYMPNYWGWGGGLESGLISREMRYFSADADGESYLTSMTGDRYRLDANGKAIGQKTTQQSFNPDGIKNYQMIQDYELFGQQYSYGCCYELMRTNAAAMGGGEAALRTSAAASDLPVAGILEERRVSIYPYYPYAYHSGRRLNYSDEIRYDEAGESIYRKTQRNTYVDGLLASAVMTLKENGETTQVKESYQFDALGKIAKVTRKVLDAKRAVLFTDERTYEYTGFEYGYNYPMRGYDVAAAGGSSDKMMSSMIWAPQRVSSVKSAKVNLKNHQTGETIEASLVYEQMHMMGEKLLRPYPIYDYYGTYYNQVRVAGTYQNKEGAQSIEGVFESSGSEHALPSEKLMALLRSYIVKPSEYKSDEQLLSELHDYAKVIIYEEFDHVATACAPIDGAVCSSAKKIFYSYMRNGDRVYQIAQINESSVFGGGESSRSASPVSEADLDRALRAAGFHAIQDSGDLMSGIVSYDKVNVESFEEIITKDITDGLVSRYNVRYSAMDCPEGGDISVCAARIYDALVTKTSVILPQAESYLKYEVSFSNETRLIVSYDGGEAYIDWQEEGSLVRTDVKTGERVEFTEARDVMSCSYPKNGPAMCADYALFPGHEVIGHYKKTLADGGYEDRFIMGLRADKNPPVEEKGSPVVTGIFQVPDDSMMSTLMRSVYTVAGESRSWLIDRLSELRETLDKLNGQKVSFIPGKSFSLEGQEIFTSGIIISDDGGVFMFEEGSLKQYTNAQFVTLSESRCPANPAMGAPCSISETAVKLPGYETVHKYEEVLLDEGWVVRRTVALMAMPHSDEEKFISVEDMNPDEVEKIRAAVGDGLELLGMEIDDGRPYDGNLVHHYVFRAVSSSLVHMRRPTGANLIKQDANGSIYEEMEMEDFGLDITVNEDLRYIREPDPRYFEVNRRVAHAEVAPGEKIILSIVKELGGRRILSVLDDSEIHPWNFTPITPESGFQMKAALLHETEMSAIHSVRLKLTGETAAKCAPGVKCSSFKDYAVRYGMKDAVYSASGRIVSTTLEGKQFLYFELSKAPSKELRIQRAIEAASAELEALAAEMKIPENETLKEEEFAKLDAKLKALAEKMRALLVRLKAVIDEIENENADPNVLRMFGGGPAGAIQLEQRAGALLSDFYGRLMQSYGAVAINGQLVKVPVKAMSDIIISALPYGRWAAPEDYERILGYKPEFNPGDGIYLMNVFQNIMFSLAMGPSYRDLREMVFEFFSRPGAEGFIRGGGVDLQLFRLSLFDVSSKVKTVISEAYLNAATEAGIAFFKAPEISVKKFDITSMSKDLPSSEFFLSVTFTADGGAELSASVRVNMTQEGVNAEVISIQTPFADLNKDAMVQKVMADLSEKTRLSLDSLKMMSVEEVNWNDGCLGVDPGPDSFCTMAIVPGFRITIVDAAGKEYVYHTNRDSRLILVTPLDSGTVDLKLAQLSADIQASYKGSNAGRSIPTAARGYGRVSEVPAEEGKKQFDVISDNRSSATARGEFVFTSEEGFSLDAFSGISFKGTIKTFTLMFVDADGNSVQQEVNLKDSASEFLAGLNLAGSGKFDAGNIRSFIILHNKRERGNLSVSYEIPKVKAAIVPPVEEPAIEMKGSGFDASALSVLSDEMLKQNEVFGGSTSTPAGMAAFVSRVPQADGSMTTRFHLAGAASEAGFVQPLQGVSGPGKPLTFAMKGIGKVLVTLTLKNGETMTRVLVLNDKNFENFDLGSEEFESMSVTTTRELLSENGKSEKGEFSIRFSNPVTAKVAPEIKARNTSGPLAKASASKRLSSYERWKKWREKRLSMI